MTIDHQSILNYTSKKALHFHHWQVPHEYVCKENVFPCYARRGLQTFINYQRAIGDVDSIENLICSQIGVIAGRAYDGG